MSQPIDPNTNLPMSLRVERIQQLKQIQAQQELDYTNQVMAARNERRQQQVTNNEEIERSRIREREQGGGKTAEREEKKKKDEQGEDKEQKSRGEKGHIIDIRI